MFSVIFDMDGTLLDTQRICITAWDWAGENQGVKDMGKLIPAVCGMNIITWSKYVTDRYPEIDIDRFNAEARQYVIEHLEVRFMPGIEKLLIFLKNNGVKIALASGSSRESINHHLKATDAEKYFDAIVGGDDVKRGKPEPDVFLKAAELIGAAPKDCFVFEDSENGIRAGFAAGMKCVGIPDIVDFCNEVNGLLFAKLKTADEIIPVFSDLLKECK